MGTYKAEASVVDFRHAPEEARCQINAWAARATRNLIKSVLHPGSIKPTSRVVLDNAVYFKGVWEDQPFDTRDTELKPFHRLDGSHFDVPFMSSGKEQFVAVHDGFKVLKLRYMMAAPDHTSSKTPPPAPFGRAELGPYFLPRPSAPAFGPFPVPQHFSGFYRPPPPPLAYPWPYREIVSSHGYPPNAYAPHPHVVAPHGYAPEMWARRYVSSPQPADDPTQFSMCIFLPDAHDGLRGLLDTIVPAWIPVSHLPKRRVDIRELRVPRFKLSFDSNIIRVLKKLGLELPFSAQADLLDT
ncbi:hypothetical protein QYE76_050123 [Lolium multiflorum]|uniref:Serpin domain-containing protein n=1 Tax=Lolium multiflorum TaxID=4521 RepID=A0AAD8SQK5_LOLMU|nr:hypothetical protein QYE76_050123 [Lolium multiflorum]